MQSSNAADATSALALLRQAAQQKNPFDLALVDIGMPPPNGIELARMIKQDPLIAATPIILLTAYGQRGEAKLATEAGAAGYLTKPLRFSQLHDCLRVVLAQSPGTIGSGSLSVDVAPLKTGIVTRHTLAEAQASQAGRILLADDSEANQLLMVRLLEKRGYLIDVVADGSETLAALARKDHDLLLLDCCMPNMDGYETARRIRFSESPGRRIPIIAMTANAYPEDRQKCLASGMDDFVAKPINRDELFKVVMRWLPIASLSK
jgi:CheY-like chemotaxis protein